MNRVAKFEKISENQFIRDYADTCLCEEERFGTSCMSVVKSIYEQIKLPQRATSGSAGYDFFTPEAFTLAPGETIKIPTGIKVSISEGWMLQMYPRSGLGFKYRLQLDNTVGIIDSDYYFSDNEGHIFVKLTNDSKDNKTVNIKSGDAICQGIFIPYGLTLDDKTENTRNGGFGSTGM